MSKETITLNYPISYADLKSLKEGDEVTITWRSTPELKSSLALTGRAGKSDIGTVHVRVDAPWLSTVGLTWCIAGNLGVSDTINRPGINVTIPRPEPLDATLGMTLRAPQGEIAVGVAGEFGGPLEDRAQWAVINPYSGSIEYMSHEDSWVLRSWKCIHPLGPVEYEDELDLDF